MQKFALGVLSAREVQQFADAAVKSGASRPELVALQGLGSMGQRPGNVHRDLMRKCFAQLAAPTPYKLACKMQRKVAGEKVAQETDCFVLLPHQWIEALQQGDLLPDLTCTGQELVHFWQSQKKLLGGTEGFLILSYLWAGQPKPK